MMGLPVSLLALDGCLDAGDEAAIVAVSDRLFIPVRIP
jgi:hypothetical protein